MAYPADPPGNPPPEAPHPPSPQSGQPPQYGAPPYGAPSPYSAPADYGAQPQFAPGYLPPEPRSLRRHPALRILSIIAAVAAFFIARVVVGGLLNSGSSSPDPSAPTAPPPAIAMPSRFGSFVQAKDQSVATAVRDKVRSGGMTDVVAAAYQESGHAGREIIVFGGEMSVVRESTSDAVFAGFFSAAAPTGATITGIAPVASGPVGGKAECAQVTYKDPTILAASCDWVTDGAQVAVIFYRYTLVQAEQDLPQILSAVVTRQ